MQKAALAFLHKPETDRDSAGDAVSFQFGKTLRLLQSSDYQSVFDQSRLKVSSPEILFLALPSQNNHPRLGLVIAKKNVRLAVQRNRIKRIVRETFRLQQNQLSGLDVIVLARRGLDKMDNHQLHDICNQLWSQLQRRAEKQVRRDKKEV